MHILVFFFFFLFSEGEVYVELKEPIVLTTLTVGDGNNQDVLHKNVINNQDN